MNRELQKHCTAKHQPWRPTSIKRLSVSNQRWQLANLPTLYGSSPQSHLWEAIAQDSRPGDQKRGSRRSPLQNTRRGAGACLWPHGGGRMVLM